MQIYDKLEFQCVAKPVRMRSCCFKTLQLPYKMRRCLFQHVANTEYCLKMLQTQKKHIQMRDFSVKMLETSWASVYLCDKIHICLPFLFHCGLCFLCPYHRQCESNATETFNTWFSMPKPCIQFGQVTQNYPNCFFQVWKIVAIDQLRFPKSQV